MLIIRLIRDAPLVEVLETAIHNLSEPEPSSLLTGDLVSLYWTTDAEIKGTSSY